MKTRCAILLLTLGFCSLTFSQVKIGDNPQTLHPASLLELEGDSRALVITRVTNAQMLGIQPLNGALVYNTDANCVFYFDGGQWVDLCSGTNTTNVSLELVDSELVLTDSDGNTVSVTLEGAVTQSITNDALVYPAPTIELTVTGNNYNFEVGQITGENIVNSSINGFDDIQPATVTENELAPDSVGEDELQNDAVTTAKIDDGTIVVAHFSDLGATTAGQVLKWNGVNWVPDTDLTGAATLNNGQLFIGDATNIPVGQTMTGDATITNDGEITIEDNAVEANMINGNIVGDGLNQNASGALEIIPGNTANQILKWDGDSWELGTDLTGATTLNDGHIFIGDATNIPVGQTMTGDATIANNGLLTIAPDAVEASMIDPNVAGNGLAQNVTTGALELLPGNAADQILKWNNGTATWELAVDQTGAGALNNGQIFIGDPTNVPVGQTMTGDASIANDGTLTIEPDAVEATMINPNVAGNGLAQNITTGALELLPGNAADQILKWNNGTATWELAADQTGAGVLNNGQIFIGDPTNVPVGQTMTGDASIANDGTLTIEPDAVEATMINPNVAGNGLAQNITTGALELLPGNAADQILKWNNGTATWELAADQTGAGALNNGQIFIGDPTNVPVGQTMTGDASIANDGTLTIEPDAVEATMINPNVAGNGLAQNITTGALELLPGNAADQILKWNNGTATWELGTDLGGTIENLATENLTQDAEPRTYNISGQNLFFTNGNIGIGALGGNPQSQLDVNGQIQARDGFAAWEGNAGNPGYGFFTNGDTDTGMFRIADDQLGFTTGGTQAMEVDATQSVIINQDLELEGSLTDNAGATGNLTQVLTADGAGGVTWEDNPAKTSGTPGSIFFAEDTPEGEATEDNINLFWNNDDKVLGIGTNTPNTATQLHINRAGGNQLSYGIQLQNADGTDSGGSATGMLFSVEGASNFGKGALAYERTSPFGRGDLHFLQNSANTPANPELADAVMTIKNNGQIGMGTTDPNARVHITEDAGNTLSFALQLQNEDGSNGGGSATAMLFSVEEVGNFGKGALAYERNASFGRGDFYFLQNSANSIASPTLADAVMTISNEGNIGIGTTAPNTKLHVNEAAGNKLDYGLQLQNADGNDSGGSATAILFSVEGLGSFGKGALAYERNSAFGRGDFHFLQNIDPDPDNPDLADAVMTIKNDGKVGIGTTAPNSILETSGSFSASIIATTANLTLDETNYTVILGGNHTVTLPAANSCQGRIYILKNTTAFTPGISNYFDSIGTLANTIPLGVTQLQSDGTNWQQIN